MLEGVIKSTRCCLRDAAPAGVRGLWAGRDARGRRVDECVPFPWRPRDAANAPVCRRRNERSDVAQASKITNACLADGLRRWRCLGRREKTANAAGQCSPGAPPSSHNTQKGSREGLGAIGCGRLPDANLCQRRCFPMCAEKEGRCTRAGALRVLAAPSGQIQLHSLFTPIPVARAPR